MKLLRLRIGFRHLWLGEVVSLLGDWLSLVAVSVLAMSHGQGALALALVLAAHTLPQVLTSPVAGALVDRFDRRRLLIGGNLIQAGLTTLMAVAAAHGAVLLVQAVLAVRTGVAAITIPAQNAALPRLVTEGELYRANTIMSATWSVMFSVGMALGGLLAALGPVPALVLDALTFLIAAGLLSRLPAIVPDRDPSDSSDVVTALGRTFSDLLQAWNQAWGSPRLLTAVLAKGPLALAGGGAWVLLNLSAAEVQVVGAGLAVGLLQAARGIGTGIGPWWTQRLLERGLSPYKAMTVAQWGTFGAVALFAVGGTLPTLLLWSFAWGCGIGTNWVVSTASLQKQAPDRIRGRLSAIDSLLFTGGMAISALIGAVVVDWTGVSASAGWTGLGLGLAGWCLTRWLIRRPRPGVDPAAASAAR